jgi:hypothetical protein
MRVMGTCGWGACARRIAAVSALTDTSSIGEHRSSPAAWRMPSPHASLTHIKSLDSAQ